MSITREITLVNDRVELQTAPVDGIENLLHLSLTPQPISILNPDFKHER